MKVNTFNYGSDNTLPTIIYCNGICNNVAIEDQKIKFDAALGVIQKAFGESKVYAFNNPTDLNEYFSRGPEQRNREEDIANQFVELIRQKLHDSNESPDKPVIILAHSHGAWITKLALEKLSPQQRDKLEVHGFGGVVMLPKALARKVNNYVYKQDYICRGGNKRYDAELTLEKRIKLHDRSRLDQVDLPQAAFTQVMEDRYAELDPSADDDQMDTESRSKKTQGYFDTFWTNDPGTVVGMEERYGTYTRCIIDYDIEIIDLPPQETLAINTNLDRESLRAEMNDRACRFGLNGDLKWHRLTAFADVLHKIVQT